MSGLLTIRKPLLTVVDDIWLYRKGYRFLFHLKIPWQRFSDLLSSYLAGNTWFLMFFWWNSLPTYLKVSWELFCELSWNLTRIKVHKSPWKNLSSSAFKSHERTFSSFHPSKNQKKNIELQLISTAFEPTKDGYNKSPKRSREKFSNILKIDGIVWQIFSVFAFVRNIFPPAL